jgi:hypothetical protein
MKEYLNSDVPDLRTESSKSLNTHFSEVGVPKYARKFDTGLSDISSSETLFSLQLFSQRHLLVEPQQYINFNDHTMV